jgi:hypothetical protein
MDNFKTGIVDESLKVSAGEPVRGVGDLFPVYRWGC